MSFEWTKSHVTPRTKEYMKGLPVSLEMSAGGRKILLFHAAPHKNNIYWYEDRPERFFQEMGGKTDAEILVYGHTHKPYPRTSAGRSLSTPEASGSPRTGTRGLA